MLDENFKPVGGEATRRTHYQSDPQPLPAHLCVGVPGNSPMAQALWALTAGVEWIATHIPDGADALFLWTDAKTVADSWQTNREFWRDAGDCTMKRAGTFTPCPELWRKFIEAMERVPLTVTIAFAQTVSKGTSRGGGSLKIPLQSPTALRMLAVKAMARKRDAEVPARGGDA